MDIVIPFKNSINHDVELKYALRSAEKYIPNMGNVFLMGDIPYWAHNNLTIVPLIDLRNSQWRDHNIAIKILRACAMPQVSDDFIILHDDNFLLKPLDPSVYWHKGVQWVIAGDYGKVITNTVGRLGVVNNYDVHAPHAVNKQRFIKSVGALDWAVPYGYCIKTAYAAMNGIPGTKTLDCKINACPPEHELLEIIADKAFFSTGDTAIKPPMLRVLQALYPQKSKYEI